MEIWREKTEYVKGTRKERETQLEPPGNIKQNRKTTI